MKKQIIQKSLGLLIFIALNMGVVTQLMAQSEKGVEKNVADQVVWMVGDEPILYSDIEYQKLRLLGEGRKFEGNPDCFIPEQIAVQKLFLNQAKIDSIQADEVSVDRMLSSWLENVIYNLGSKEKVEEYFNKKMSQIKEDERREIRNMNIVNSMQRKITANVQVSPSEIRNYYKSLPQDSLPYMPKTLEVQIISIEPKIDYKEVDRVKDKLRDFSKQIMSGEKDFRTLARLYSEDKRTAIKGGAYGFVGRTSLEPKFAEVVFDLKDDKHISQIVKTEDGYHIVQLIEKRGDLVNFRHILLRPSVDETSLVDATKRLDSIRTYINEGKYTFAQAAEAYSQDEDTRNAGGLISNRKEGSEFMNSAYFLLEDLPQDVALKASQLKEGEISKPFILKERNGNELVAIIRLKAIHPEHFANLNTDYRKIKEMAKAVKQSAEIDKWIRRKQKETPIVIRVHYDDCAFRYPGWVQEDK